MFNPVVEVITEQPRVLAAPNLSFEALLGHFPGLADAEAVCLTGSITAGWGNVYSDHDIYAFADQDLVLPVDETMETWPGDNMRGLRWKNWMGRYGDSRIDLKVWPTRALEGVLAPFLIGAEPEFGNLGEAAEDFIYRLYIGDPLKNSDFFLEKRELINGSSYRRATARRIKALAENSLTDVAGQLDAGDFMTARISSAMAASQVADVGLLLAGQICRGNKWLLRRLQSTPECGISPDEYRSMVLDGPRPGESEKDCAVRVARWAQRHLIRLEPELLQTS